VIWLQESRGIEIERESTEHLVVLFSWNYDDDCCPRQKHPFVVPDLNAVGPYNQMMESFRDVDMALTDVTAAR